MKYFPWDEAIPSVSTIQAPESESHTHTHAPIHYLPINISLNILLLYHQQAPHNTSLHLDLINLLYAQYLTAKAKSAHEVSAAMSSDELLTAVPSDSILDLFAQCYIKCRGKYPVYDPYLGTYIYMYIIVYI